MKKLKFKAVIFDLDGVITKTAAVHSAAWKKMFDTYLKERESKYDEPFKEFTHEHDYLPYVDGKPRYKGVNDFLQSRGINIPFGNPDDAPKTESCCGLGNRKNYFFNQILEEEGVGIFESTIDLIKQLKENNIRIGVASSSKNCKPILESVDLLKYFETRVDGIVSAELGLKGKPEPDIFTVAADNLGVNYDETIIVEDAVSGVQAGSNGNFGLVLGIAREENEKELSLNGADIVVTDLSEISLDDLNDWFENGLKNVKWSITYKDYNPSKEKSREALLTVGNGYFGTRGALEEINACDSNYPGTYIAGLYNRLISKVGDRDIENEDFVNCPNWLPITFKIGDGKWFDPNNCEILDVERTLNFRNGLLIRKIRVRDSEGNETQIVSKRIASMKNPHLASINYVIKPLNYSGKITINSSIDGNIINDGVTRYRQLNQQHLKGIDQDATNNKSYVIVETTQSEIQIAEASKVIPYINGRQQNIDFKTNVKDSKVSNYFSVDLTKNETVGLDKIVSIYTSKDFDTEDPIKSANLDLSEAKSFKQVLEESEKEWAKIWDEIDIQITGDRFSQMLLRLHLYHLMVSASIHNKDIDASFTARGLHGEAYRGHIFWDELFILPFYNIHLPETAKSTLLYRYRRLNKAREYAKEYGFEGAMIPWQIGSDGREETQIIHLNPLTGKWGDDHSSLQRHVSLAVAYNVWQYFTTTNDLEFLQNYGAEMFLDICKFWVSKCELNDKTGRYSIDKVMGPDEFHEMYPDANHGGLRDNSYSNIMVAWSLNRAFEFIELVDSEEILNTLEISQEDLKKWKEISKNLNIVNNENGILSQYNGYFNLKELDWDAYREKYGNIYRLDRILKAEGKSADDFKVAKQADTLMTFYNLDEDVVTDILDHLNYSLPKDYLKKNLEYYLARTSHGSTLSRVVHAQLAAMIGDKDLSWALFSDALASDFVDIQGGTTGEGIHAGVMAGTIMIALTTYAGLNLRSEIVKIQPDLPKFWRAIKFNFRFKGARYFVELTKEELKIMFGDSEYEKQIITVKGIEIQLNANQWQNINLI